MGILDDLLNSSKDIKAPSADEIKAYKQYLRGLSASQKKAEQARFQGLGAMGRNKLIRQRIKAMDKENQKNALSRGGTPKKKMMRGGAVAKKKMRGGGMAKMASKKMRGGGVAAKKMRGGGMPKMAKKMMRGGVAKKKMMRGGVAKKK